MVELDRGRSEQQVISEILGNFNLGLDLNSTLDRTVELLASYLRCEAVGIRVMDKLGNIPYESYRGFSDGFIAKEGPLCIRHDRCACIEVSKGEYDPSIPLYTTYGSFFTNNLQNLQPVRDGMKSGRFRGECLRSGWNALALVPIRFRHTYFGLIHAVDREKDGITEERVRLIENIAAQLGLYLHGLQAREEREREFSFMVQRIMHDLRTPLTSTMMFTELLSTEHSDRLDPEMSDFLERISRNADYMEQLISGLGGFASACDPSVRKSEEIDIGRLVSSIASDLGLEEQAGLKVRVGENLPKITYSPLCLRRVLTNLISNASKFTSDCDSPTVEVNCNEKDMFYQLSVSDNGIGMEESDVEQVFAPFFRTEAARNIPGTGLGLSICRKIIEKNGGRIWVYSDKGKGSTFYFTVPKQNGK